MEKVYNHVLWTAENKQPKLNTCVEISSSIAFFRSGGWIILVVLFFIYYRNIDENNEMHVHLPPQIQKYCYICFNKFI